MAKTANLQQLKNRTLLTITLQSLREMISVWCLLIKAIASVAAYSCVMVCATNPLPTSDDNCVNIRNLQNMLQQKT